MKETADNLRAAKALVEAGWTRHTMARDRHSRPTPVLGGTAVRFCPIGAISKVTTDGDEEHRARIALTRAISGGNISLFNDADGRTKRQVLAAFSTAIEAEEAAP